MKLKKWLYSSFLALAATFMFAHSASAASAGSYASNSVGPTIYSKNYAYYNYFPIVGSHPSNGRITTVSYNWSFSYRPSGLNVWLCHGTTDACINVSSSQTGSTNAFANRSPTSQFFLVYWVSGSGTMTPAYSNSHQVIVNYNIP